MTPLDLDDVDWKIIIIDRFRDCPRARVVSFFTTLGGYNLVALVMALASPQAVPSAKGT